MRALPEISPISDLRHRQKALLEKVSEEPVVLTQRGKGVAVLVGLKTWNELMEELEDLREFLEAKEEDGPDVEWDDLKAEAGL